ncbi:MAG: DUF397 domain-containing protein [Trebonia sp.]
MEDSPELRWRTASYSTGNGGNCIEVADAASVVLVRDTKNRAGGTLSVPADAWQRFANALK